MKFSSIRFEGNILGNDLLNKIEDGSLLHGQTPSDFGLKSGNKISDEIRNAWTTATNQWQIFKERRERMEESDFGTTIVRNFWMDPLLYLLGYQPELERKAETILNRPYNISHRDNERGRFPIHIVGFQDRPLEAPEKRSTLDVKSSSGTARMSPHATVQEYLNLTEHLYGIVSNGLQLRLLRDSSRLVKLSFIEFNLEQIMEEQLFSDFRMLFRLIHATRMPRKEGEGSESLIESYHQESLISGESIRDGLGEAVEASIRQLANGFLQHPGNSDLRELIENNQVTARDFYRYLLRLIYRLLFLMVIEERKLVFAKDTDSCKQAIYYDFYSVNRLRKLAESNLHADKRFTDYWEALKNTFRLFEKEYYGQKLDVKPLAGDLFSVDGIGYFNNCSLDNKTLIESLKRLGLFYHRDTSQLIRVNYGNLNVEEFGSVYEGLLEYEPELKKNGLWEFGFKEGNERSRTGSHYTPDEVVQPLIKHSLDHLIKDRLDKPESFVRKNGNADQVSLQELALLDLNVADVACGSGHILLSAARRIGLELARVRTGEDQPSPEAMRKAIRDVITQCIYGVDINPMAVELCKVALWIEAHSPGEPLNFLDHQIKCGDAIVGLAHFKELQQGIPNDAFKKADEDDKTVQSGLAKINKAQKKKTGQLSIRDISEPVQDMRTVLESIDRIGKMPENSSAEIESKKRAYEKFVGGKEYWHLKTLADIPVAQFFIPKKQSKKEKIITQNTYEQYLSGTKSVQGQDTAMASGVAAERRFFHWFLEFPEVINKGGFDCILGNPPFLGDRRLKQAYSNNFLNWIRYNYTPGATVDLVVYFFKRAFSLINSHAFQSLISTNTVSQGKARDQGLSKIMEEGGVINHAVKSMKWPGKAAVEVALVSITKQQWKGRYFLGGREVKRITSYLDDAKTTGDPFPLKRNENQSFQGSIVLGEGFVLTPTEAQNLIDKNPKNKNVIYPYLNGDDLNNRPDQSPSRYVINFWDWPLRRYSPSEWQEIDKKERSRILDRVSKGKPVVIGPPNYEREVAENYPDCLEILEERVKPIRTRWAKDSNGNEIVGKYQLRGTLPIYWWRFAETRPKLYASISRFNKVLAVGQVSKFINFEYVPTNIVLDSKLIVIAENSIGLWAILQSALHQEWISKYATTLETRLNYTPTVLFEPFPIIKSIYDNSELLKVAEEYYETRSSLMKMNQLGLTKLYNLYNSNELKKVSSEELTTDKEKFESISGREGGLLKRHLSRVFESTELYNETIEYIFKLQKTQIHLDTIVLEIYGWSDIDLRHDFYVVNHLPENDNIRFTIHPEARREILERLFELNHTIFEKEARQGLHKKKNVEAFYKQKGQPLPNDVEFLDKKRKKAKPKPKPAKKQKAEEGVQTLFDILDREETMKPRTVDEGIYSIIDAKNIINSVLEDDEKKVTYSQVRHWFKGLAELNYRGFTESIDKDIDNMRISFHGLLELYVIGKLSVNGFRLREIIDARENLVRNTGKLYPFASNEINKSLEVHGSSIDFKYEGVGIITLDGTSQFNLDIIDEFFRDIKFENGMATRIVPRKGDGKIVIDPAICAGKLAVESQKIEVETIFSLIDGGETTESIVAEYGFKQAEIEASLKFMN